MKCRLYKKLLFFCLSVLVAMAVVAPNTLVYGASNEGAFLNKDVDEVTDKSTILTRGNFLNYGTVTLSRIGTMKVRLVGDTAAHRVCDRLGVALFLEKSTDGVHYESYRQWKFSKENDSFFWKGLEVIVPSGYWYRLGGGHVAVVGNDGESTTTLTNGLYVY